LRKPSHVTRPRKRLLDAEDHRKHLCDEEDEALDQLASRLAPAMRNSSKSCATYLPDNGDNYGCIVIAAACHFCPVNA
jgi:hypothetical protein